MTVPVVAVTVIPGEVRVASIWLVRATEDHVHIEMDFHTKHADFTAEGSKSFSDERDFYVDASDEALHLDEGLRGTSTCITVRGVPKDWTSVTLLSRYTGRIVLLRRQDDDVRADEPLLWSDGS